MNKRPILILLLGLVSDGTIALEETSIEIIQRILTCENNEGYCFQEAKITKNKTIDVFITFEHHVNNFNEEKSWDYMNVLTTPGEDLKKVVDNELSLLNRNENTRLFIRHNINGRYMYYYQGYNRKGKGWMDVKLSLGGMKDYLRKDSFINLEY
ncbi:hypothetical protein [Enterovibrio norvegicus]|uniref:hypothetical protein n=1 Tax=Enterovibrio norvegicus TaxID=188144 RepID=UPI0024B1F4F5|nr:hypothetical protein [Enterovibrio norvegicus]